MREEILGVLGAGKASKQVLFHFWAMWFKKNMDQLGLWREGILRKVTSMVNVERKLYYLV